MIIENKELKPLIEMTDEEIVAIVRGMAEREVEILLNGVWEQSYSNIVSPKVIYRLIPKYTPITVDWSVLDDSIQWIAADRYDGQIAGTDATGIYPSGEGHWIAPRGHYHYIKGIIKSLNRGDIPWDQSLIKRPEGRGCDGRCNLYSRGHCFGSSVFGWQSHFSL